MQLFECSVVRMFGSSKSVRLFEKVFVSSNVRKGFECSNVRLFEKCSVVRIFGCSKSIRLFEFSVTRMFGYSNVPLFEKAS